MFTKLKRVNVVPELNDDAYNRFFRQVITYGWIGDISDPREAICSYMKDLFDDSILEDTSNKTIMLAGYFLYEAYCCENMTKLPKKTSVNLWISQAYKDAGILYKMQYINRMYIWLNLCPSNWFYPEKPYEA